MSAAALVRWRLYDDGTPPRPGSYRYAVRNLPVYCLIFFFNFQKTENTRVFLLSDN